MADVAVNGAGLAMATNDTIELLHGSNANFLDAGGKATPETIKEAFRLVLKSRNVPLPVRQTYLTAG
jgi:succinyl-CoA synthetase beta subunit